MDPANTDLISPTSLAKKKMNNQPKDSNFESYGIINHSQNQGEINFVALSADAPLEGTLGQFQNDAIAREQERLEQASGRRKKFIYAQANSQRNGRISRLPKWKLNFSEGVGHAQGMEIEEIEEKKVHSENDEDDIFDNSSDKNEGSVIQAEEEKVDLEESQVFEGSNGSTQEPPIQVIEENNGEDLELNESKVLKSWNGDNEDLVLQCLEERFETDFIANGSLKDSNGNNEIQDIEDNMNANFNLNVNESFEHGGSLCEEKSKWQQKTFHRPNETDSDEIFFVVAEKSFRKDHTKA